MTKQQFREMAERLLNDIDPNTKWSAETIENYVMQYLIAAYDAGFQNCRKLENGV